MKASNTAQMSTSVLPFLTVVAPDPVLLPEIDPRQYMFTNYTDAVAWRNSLNEEQEAYLFKIDKFMSELQPDRIVDLLKKVPDPLQRPHFYRCLSYIILGCNMFGDIAFNDDFTTMRLNNKWFEK